MRRARDQPNMGIGGASPHSSPSFAVTPTPTRSAAARARRALCDNIPLFPRRRPPLHFATLSLISLAVVLLPPSCRRHTSRCHSRHTYSNHTSHHSPHHVEAARRRIAPIGAHPSSAAEIHPAEWVSRAKCERLGMKSKVVRKGNEGGRERRQKQVGRPFRARRAGRDGRP